MFQEPISSKQTCPDNANAVTIKHTYYNEMHIVSVFPTLTEEEKMLSRVNVTRQLMQMMEDEH